MNIAISTGTFYKVPFYKVLELIKKAGFEYIELLQHWQGGSNWEVAQHLKRISPKETLKLIRESGLKISSLHDGGGVIEEGKESVVAKSTYEFLEFGNDEIPCIVFHVPHKKTNDKSWANVYRSFAGKCLNTFKNQIICIENMPEFNGYETISSEPYDLLKFTTEYDIYINFDSTHYAQMDINIVDAAQILRDRVRTVHLSDYKNPNTHVYPGEGDLNLSGMLKQLNKNALHAITIECSIEYNEKETAKTIDRLKKVLCYVKHII